MKLITALSFTLLFGFILTPSQNAQELARPNVSVKPHSMMQKLTALQGRWRVTTETTNDGGENWQTNPAYEVVVHLRHKGMLMAEVPINPGNDGFHMETYISYDQYRNVFRKAAIDDVWGVMDLYEGNFEDNKLVFTNLKSGTFFPVGEKKWRAFRLQLTLTSPVREMLIEASDDAGIHWQPAFKVNYQKID